MSKWILFIACGLVAFVAWRSCSDGAPARSAATLAAPPAAQAIELCAPGAWPDAQPTATQPPAADAGLVFEQAVRGQLERLAGLIARPAALEERALEPLTAFVFRCRPLRPRALVREWSDGVVTLFLPAAEEMAGVDHVGREGLRKTLLALVEPLRGAGGGIEVELETLVLDVERLECTVRYRASARPPRGAVQQNASWRCRWAWSGAAEAAPRLESIELDRFEELHAEPGPAPFADCTAAVLGGSPAWRAELLPGLDHFAERLDRALGVSLLGHHGLSVGDVNGDGLDDLFVCQPAGLPNRLFVQNPDGSTTEVAKAAGLDHLDAASSALLVDFDGDGDQDLCVALGSRLAFFANNGQGAFVPATLIDARSPGALCAADYDLDGDVDVYACGHGLLRNAGGLQFEDTTGAAGLVASGRSAAWEDYDNDGDPDLYVASSRGWLFRNDRDGKFVDVTGDMAVGGDAGAVGDGSSVLGTGVSWADFDGDGLMDLYVSGTSSSSGGQVLALQAALVRAGRRHLVRGNTLYQGTGGLFREVGLERGASSCGWAFGARFVELDDDGLPDLYVPNGLASAGADFSRAFWGAALGGDEGGDDAWVRERLRAGGSLGGRERDLCLLNAGSRFVDASRLLGLDCAGDGRAVASVDWDQDGDLDLWVASRSGPRLRFLRNDLARAEGSIALRLVGRRVNRDAIGARVKLALTTPDGPVLRSDSLRAGDGYLAQSSKWLHFPVGAGARIESVEVRWPGGTRERFSGIEPGGRYELVEDSARATAQRGGAQRSLKLTPSVPAVPAPTAAARVVLAARPPFVGLSFESAPEGLELPLSPRDVPLLVTLWRPGCAGCATQLAQLAEVARVGQSAARPVEILALAVDGGEPRAAAQAALDACAWPHGAGFASSDLTRALDLLQRALVERPRGLQLPASFLVDRSGHLVVITTGLLEPQQLARDLDLLDLPAHARIESAAPFTGRWLGAAPSVDYAGLESAFRAAGLAEVADAVAQAQLAASAARPVKSR